MMASTPSCINYNSMICPPNDASYRGRWWPLLTASIRDRLRGETGRANARCGFVLPPPGTGRVIWIKCAGQRDDVRLAFALLEAIRSSRQDARLVLSYQCEYTEFLEPVLAKLPKTGVGFGPADHPRVVRRVLERFQPAGIVLVGGQYSDQLYAIATAQGVPIERVGVEDAAVDLLTTVVQAQVEPHFAAAVRDTKALQLWWVHGVDASRAQLLLASWQSSGLASQGVLLLSDPDFSPVPRQWLTPQPRLISDWARDGLSAGEVMVIDQSRWLPAVAASCHAVHVEQVGRWDGWQFLALGQPASASPDGALQFKSLLPELDIRVLGHMDEVMAYWASDEMSLVGQRRDADVKRRAFWQHRRQAQADAESLLQRIYEW